MEKLYYMNKIVCITTIWFLVLIFPNITISQNNESCIDRETTQVEEANRSAFLYTLDGQKIILQEFYNACDQFGPPKCVLFYKFYCWKSEIKKTTSLSHNGLISHTIRVYYDPASVCFPEMANPLRIYGDVAEFYDACGEFMGLAVYMGNGEYFPLKFSGYSKKSWIYPSPVPKKM